MYTGYARFNGTEIFNNQRTLAYLAGNMALGIKGLKSIATTVNADCGCQTLGQLYCDAGSGPDGEFLSPALDNAPWYDPDVPESAEFAGLFIEEIDGFDSTIKREVSDGAILGSSLGPMKLSGRCMTFTGWLRSSSCCGAEYGLRWLQEALMSSNNCEGCSLSDLYMVKCCPPATDTCHTQLESESRPDDDIATPITITDLGGGIYTIKIDDPTGSNVIFDPTGAANNIDGIIPSCYADANSIQFSYRTSIGSVYNFLLPLDAITNYVTAASGGGSSATFTIDTTITSDCEDMQGWITDFAEDAVAWGVSPGFGVANSGVFIGTIKCWVIRDGYDPDDYVRLFHRTGLTDGPKVIERRGSCCTTNCGCTNLKVQFTLCSELPYIYSDVKWCAEDQPFDLDAAACLNTRNLCRNCGGIGTKIVQRQVPRPQCPVSLRHDGTWCAEGWDPDEACPPVDCALTIGTLVEYEPDTAADDGCEEQQITTDICEIALGSDFTWDPVAFDMADGFPPPFCTLKIQAGGECDTTVDPPEEPCLVRVVYNTQTQERTWEPIRWDGVLPAVSCPCIEIAEICIESPAETADGCIIPQDCEIRINCDGTYTPLNWTLDTQAAFPPAGCNFVIVDQDTSPIIEEVEVPADEFIPDCGPFPIPPPQPFTVASDCYCDPWVSTQLCCTFENPGDWNSATSYIEINTGSAAMRHLKIEAYNNPFGPEVPCPCDPNDEFWICRDPCSTILVPQLPSGAKLIIDSRLRTADLILAGGRRVNGLRYLSSGDGSPFNWFDIGPCSTFCVVVSVDANHVATDATVSIGAVGRYVSSGW